MACKNPAIVGSIIPREIVTGTAASGAVTAQGLWLDITTESLTTAAAAEYTLTLTDARITANSFVWASVGLGSSTAGTPGIGGITPAAGSCVITVTNLHASNAFNGTLKIKVWVTNPA